MIGLMLWLARIADSPGADPPDQVPMSRRRFFKVKRSRYLISLTHGFNMIECNATATPVNSNTTNGLLACSND